MIKKLKVEMWTLARNNELIEEGHSICKIRNKDDLAILGKNSKYLFYH